MTYQRFEDLPVWNTAVDLYEAVDEMLELSPPRLRHSFRDQLERAALSVSNNVAEGFERGSTNELLKFIYIARGSAGEVRSMLCILERRRWMTSLSSEISSLKSVSESCSRQLRAWAESLQNSAIKGQRHLNNKVRGRGLQEKNGQDLPKLPASELPSGRPKAQAARKRGEIQYLLSASPLLFPI